jgi:hypothetical protein
VIVGGAVYSLETDSLAPYRLATPGKKNSYTAANAGVIKLKSSSPWSFQHVHSRIAVAYSESGS